MRALSLLSICCLALLGCDDDDPVVEPDAAPPAEVGALESALRPVDAALDPALLGVWGAADDAVWFAGGTPEPDGGALLRFDGSVISPEAIPEGPMLWWVWGADGERVWACGEGGRIIARTADGWVDEPTGLDEKAVLWGLWGSGPNDLWAVGGSVRRNGPKGLLMRSTGDGVWTRVDDPSLPADLNLYKVWGSGPDDVWLVGEGTVTVHWDGAAFRRVDLGVRDLLFTVHGRADGPILAVGGAGSGLIYALEGDTWRAEVPDGTIGLNGVFVTDEGTALATGLRGAVLFRDAGARWHRLRLDAAATIGQRTLHAAWRSPGGQTWTVGGDLTQGIDGIIVTDRSPTPAMGNP